MHANEVRLRLEVVNRSACTLDFFVHQVAMQLSVCKPQRNLCSQTRCNKVMRTLIRRLQRPALPTTRKTADPNLGPPHDEKLRIATVDGNQRRSRRKRIIPKNPRGRRSAATGTAFSITPPSFASALWPVSASFDAAWMPFSHEQRL
eukprot:TRINITY_DN22351_c0_g1_i3.p1 TRINITY_DN22351_c0_g1~~TRINITY_DN22351_c0_g1_i3.p1  ORF type:complete len:147 (-),score=9.44 TRINITY_DN22351_c0_g1_i3:38-478(-)